MMKIVMLLIVALAMLLVGCPKNPVNMADDAAAPAEKTEKAPDAGPEKPAADAGAPAEADKEKAKGEEKKAEPAKDGEKPKEEAKKAE